MYYADQVDTFFKILFKTLQQKMRIPTTTNQPWQSEKVELIIKTAHKAIGICNKLPNDLKILDISRKYRNTRFA